MISIEKSGIMTTIQGAPRSGYLSMGFPASGPMDSVSMRAANYLLGRPAWQSCLEMYIKGPQVRFHQDMQIAICGADMQPTVNGYATSQNTIIDIKANDVLAFQPAKNGMIAYLAFNGAVKIPDYLHSTSTYLAAGFGGLSGRSLRAGDKVHFETLEKSTSTILPNRLRFAGQQHASLRILKGPEFQLFDKGMQNRFLQTTFKVSPDSNRMGIRLQSEKGISPAAGEINSSAIVPGTIQVPSSGSPIVLSQDHQTTGGYPRIANVITHDMPYLAQLQPGAEVSFRLTTLSKAQQLLFQREQYLTQLFNKLHQTR